MSADAFFDTTILVYAAIPTDRRYAAARALIAGGGVVGV